MHARTQGCARQRAAWRNPHGPSLTLLHPVLHALPAGLPTTGPPGPAGRSLDESFVVLPGSASLLRPPAGAGTATAPARAGPRVSFDPGSVPGGGGSSGAAAAAAAVAAGPSAAGSAPGSDPTTLAGAASSAAGLDAKLQALAALFELASSRTQVDHPLCLDCAAQLKEEIDARVGHRARWRHPTPRGLRCSWHLAPQE
jgi:hypothetical protein